MRRILVALLALALVLSTAGTALAQGKPPETPTIRVGILPFSESLPAVIADKQGFFREEGLTVEFSRSGSAAQAVPLLQAGRLDIMFSNTVSTLQAIEQGLDAMILAPGAVVRVQPPDTTSALMVLKGAATTPKDLEGKRIAVNVVNSTAWMHLVALLDKHGVHRSKVRFTEVPFPQMNDTLLTKQVDAITQVEPFRTVLSDAGKTDIIGWLYVDTHPNAEITQYIALTPWVTKNPTTVAKFARAIVRAAQFANTNEAASRTINVEFTRLNPALKDRVLLPRFGTEVNMVEIRKTMDLMMKYGLLKQPQDLSKRMFRAP